MRIPKKEEAQPRQIAVLAALRLALSERRKAMTEPELSVRTHSRKFSREDADSSGGT
jgi:hypothetical protein